MNSKGRTLVSVKYTEQKIIREPVLKNIYWYDSFYKKSHNFMCSRLDYKFVEQMYIEKEDGNRIPVVHSTQEDLVKYSSNIRKANILTVEPKIYEVDVKKEISNKQKIEKWFRDWENYNHTKVDVVEEDSKEILFSVPNTELDNFIYELDRNNIKYNIN